jgi:hypothetical protein
MWSTVDHQIGFADMRVMAADMTTPLWQVHLDGQSSCCFTAPQARSMWWD